MKLIVGLGNPGEEYENTRHNFGFLVADSLAGKLGGNFKKSRFKAEASSVEYNGEKIILVKPLTFMNLSGEAVSAALHYYKATAEDLVIIVDDLDLPLGRLRWAGIGSAGGHNGLKSIIEHLGTQDFCRLRMGIGRPGHTNAVVDHVLSVFSKNEKAQKEVTIEKARDSILYYIENGLEKTMNHFNGN